MCNANLEPLIMFFYKYTRSNVDSTLIYYGTETMGSFWPPKNKTV